MTDMSIAPPGRPDLGTEGAPGLDVDELGPQGDAGVGVSLPTVIGLVRSAAAILAQVIGAQYPERPGIGAMTEEEATGIATALVSWSTHNPALRTALERSDALAVAFYLSGWAGRTTTDIAAVRRERKANAADHREAEVNRPGAGDGAGSPGSGYGPRGGAGGDRPDHRGIA